MKTNPLGCFVLKHMRSAAFIDLGGPDLICGWNFVIGDHQNNVRVFKFFFLYTFQTYQEQTSILQGYEISML